MGVFLHLLFIVVQMVFDLMFIRVNLELVVCTFGHCPYRVSVVFCLTPMVGCAQSEKKVCCCIHIPGVLSCSSVRT